MDGFSLALEWADSATLTLAGSAMPFDLATFDSILAISSIRFWDWSHRIDSGTYLKQKVVFYALCNNCTDLKYNKFTKHILI